MRRPDRLFALGALLATASVPVLLGWARPFGESRAVLGVAAGWAVALLVMVPSYVLLSRAMAAGGRRFMAGFLGGVLGRLVVTAVAVVLFWLLVSEPPIKSFVLAYLLGYVALTMLELGLTVLAAPQRSAS